MNLAELICTITARVYKVVLHMHTKYMIFSYFTVISLFDLRHYLCDTQAQYFVVKCFCSVEQKSNGLCEQQWKKPFNHTLHTQKLTSNKPSAVVTFSWTMSNRANNICLDVNKWIKQGLHSFRWVFCIYVLYFLHKIYTWSL